jgi:hypothetical protein
MVSEYALIIYIVSGIVSSAIILGFVLSSKRSSKEEFKSFQILSIEAPKLFVDEWGKIIVKIKGKGKVSINLEGDVEWIKPELKELSGESTIEIPVKPKVSGEVPVKIIVASPYGKKFQRSFYK